MYPINFSFSERTFYLILHYTGANNCLFVNGTDIFFFFSKDSKTVVIPLRLGNFSEDFTVDNIRKTGLYGYVYYFSVDYDHIAVADILDIHKYLIKNNGIV